MKHKLTILLQTTTILIGLSTLAFLLIEPNFEGRNIGANFWQIYFNDLFLAYAYLSSVPFFIILFQTYKMLGSGANLKSLKIIKKCTLLNILLVLIGEVWISFDVSDDRTGAFFMGLLIILGSLMIRMIASQFERAKK